VRKAILEKTLILKKKTLPDEIVDFLAQNIASNVRDLKGALNSVLGYTEMTGQKPSIEIAKKFLVDSFHKVAESQVTIEQVQRAVAEHFHLTITDLKSPKRTKNIVQARHKAMYIAKELTGASDTEIGSEFGGRDPSTVNHSRDVVQDECSADGEYDETIKMLTRRIRDSMVITK
jgi:chromosomal replication initiator protein